jgi:hypothetical protein
MSTTKPQKKNAPLKTTVMTTKGKENAAVQAAKKKNKAWKELGTGMVHLEHSPQHANIIFSCAQHCTLLWLTQTLHWMPVVVELTQVDLPHQLLKRLRG